MCYNWLIGLLNGRCSGGSEAGLAGCSRVKLSARQGHLTDAGTGREVSYVRSYHIAVYNTFATGRQRVRLLQHAAAAAAAA